MKSFGDIFLKGLSSEVWEEKKTYFRIEKLKNENKVYNKLSWCRRIDFGVSFIKSFL